MQRRTRLALGTAIALTAAGAGTGIAVAAGGGDDGEGAITGPALAKAGRAALGHTGPGKVTATEVGDEDSYYEVEVTLPDGSQVDVQLDRNFAVVGGAPDVESPGADDGARG
jgi:hypothetical protein